MEFISAFVGALIGGAFVIFGTYLAWQLNLEQESEKIKFTLEALNEEMNELFKIATDIFKIIKSSKVNGAVEYFLKSNQNYFSTYENNSNIIGAISDEQYRSCIVKHYLLSKRFMDALLTNTFYLEKTLDSESDKFNKMLHDEADHLNYLADEIEKSVAACNANHERFMKAFQESRSLILKKWMGKIIGN